MPTVTAPAAFFCDGDSFAAGNQGVVAGRLGKGSGNAPYKNPFGDGALCRNNGNADGQYSNGRSYPNGAPRPADGYKAITASGFSFNRPITVWRNPTYAPLFGTYAYRLSPMTGWGKSIDVWSGSQSNGTAIQQWSSSDNDAQKFNIMPSGGNWKIAMKANNGKCVGPAGNGTGNGTVLEVQDCNGGANQAWSVTADASSGGFTFRNIAANRCMDLLYGNTADGARIGMWDCNGGVNQKYKIQAY